MIARGELFSGTEAPPEKLALALESLQRYLAVHLDGIGELQQAEKFKGGQSNPTYLLTTSADSYVLRRKPPGTLLASAHAIDREYRILAILAGAGIPVPRPLHYCEDESVIGSQFYIVEYIAGRVFWDAEMPGAEPASRASVYDQMNATLARLHDLDIDATGLDGLGRRYGYLERNFARWSGVYDKSRLVDIPDMDWLIGNLPRRLPAGETVSLVHGDFGLYNIIVDEDRSEIRAVIDWEMATLGDPFVDLAHHLRAWWEFPSDTGAATSLRGHDLPALGIPTMERYVESYCHKRGISVPDMRPYLGYAQFRYAAMMQGILKRAQMGTASSRRVLHTQDRVIQMAELARRTLEG